MWDATIQTASRIWNRALEVGIELTLLNIGGGFPVKYQEEVTKPAEYGRYISEKINTAFSGIKTLMLEPGRAIVATAGSIAARVMLVSNKGDFQYNWVYLNVGRFSGLAETEGESIRYRFTVLGKEQEPTRQFKVAGPTCDSADILYERNVVSLPRSITYDDIVVINDCGAYTSTYSTICFNGFEPLQVVHV
jgi:ornithine decarboxylase